MRERLRRGWKAVLNRAVGVITSRQTLADKTSASTRASIRNLYLRYRRQVMSGETLPAVTETGFRVFSQFDEDGILLFLLAVAGSGTRRFVDIGAGDGYTGSNCANLALNLGYHGLLIDGNPVLADRARRFYAAHPDSRHFPPVVVCAKVTRGNVNSVIEDAGFEGDIDVLTIDIDGNDYWIWEAIDCIRPRIVLVEAHVEFGMESIVVPYDEDFTWRPGMHPHYLGASPVALTKLGSSRGYTLVAANRLGFNLFYLRNDIAGDVVPRMPVEEIFRHEFARERMKVFEEIRDREYEVV